MKRYRIITLFLYVLIPTSSFASVSINEIMYDVSGSDTGREWVEIYNNDSASVDISNWKFLEATNVSNHSLTLVQGVSTILENGYAVIVSDSAKFLLDYPNFSGNLFKASFSSLNNTSGTLTIKDGSLGVQDQVSYVSTQGAAGDSNSLQKSGSSWNTSIPTPGQLNAGVGAGGESGNSNATTTQSEGTSSSQDTETTPDNDNSSAHSSPASLSELNPKMDFQVSAGRDRLATVGNNIAFQAVVTKIQGVSERDLNYLWSFGDGTTYGGNTVNHTYLFPGEYTVVLNSSYADKQAVSRVNIKVSSPDLTISVVQGGVEITNKSKAEINLEDWGLESRSRSFVFPKDTLIPAGKKVIFANSITGILDDNVTLFDPLRKRVLAIQSSVENTQTSSIQTIEKSINDIQNQVKNITPKSTIKPYNTPEKITENVAATSSEQANVIMVFQAKREQGFVGKVLSLPGRSFNFIKRLFVED